ncbi:hypothetical protein N7462_002050 [Penicillium macrosclerotiorum]|uniref:uncharacterized protein n=1 Tax=Penicillium macrosclerotiorum TaxID=303699 RepID=UPI0025499B47|nr:uncharacterized protein N7462_002050 [Penicillium macrosclerotiorum]KAJ5692627.1 hypothetical protein N7462_002050 [Penicillium macrosclerotiorum]
MNEDPATFPAPLLLPGDDLAEDPDYPPQSFQEWLDEEERNPVTPKRQVIYIAYAPQIDGQVQFMRKWDKPERRDGQPSTELPAPQSIREYIAAFYHGLLVKSLPITTLSFTTWEEGSQKLPARLRPPKYVGLRFGDDCVRIRARACPDGIFAGQLNLNDLLDAAIEMLPEDAFSLLLLVNQDLYEDDDDDFACGRAYGGSRVAVVSSARYNPNIDGLQSVELEHAWPASHCKDYMAMCYASSGTHVKRQKRSGSKNALRGEEQRDSETCPLEAAISSYKSLSSIELSSEAITSLWLGRVCRTAAHELGHCFGIDHCVYYACAMQGTASMSEDVRQPPYLCPVDLAKLLHATSTTETQRYQALLAFCEKSNRLASYAVQNKNYKIVSQWFCLYQTARVGDNWAESRPPPERRLTQIIRAFVFLQAFLSCNFSQANMAATVDSKLLKQTKFPPEFNRKVDMTKVNIEVMKKWIAGRISEILGNEDDVIIELCFNLLEGSRYPDIKSLQIQLTGFLDKDTSTFCKELWSLCLSGQENPQGVPKELLEAKKLELIQEKIEAEKAAEASRRQQEQDRVRERDLDDLRRRERADRGRGRRGPGRSAEIVIVNPHLGATSILTFRLALREVVDPPALLLVPLPALPPVLRPVVTAVMIVSDLVLDNVAVTAAPDPRITETADIRRAALRTMVIETDLFPAVVPHAHVVPEETRTDGVLSPAA